MSAADAVAALILLGLTAYAVLAGADFGAGFWDLAGAGRARAGRARKLIDSSMGPVWEANHVWLIFVLVIFWTGFPEAFAAVASTLCVPLFLAAIGIILRGTAFATRGVVTSGGSGRAFAALFALSSLLTPFFLGATVGGVASGRVPLGNAEGDQLTSWWNPTSALVGGLAVVTGAYLAAVYLAADAAGRGDRDLSEAFRLRALVAGVVAGAVAIGGLAVLRHDARPLYDGLTGDAAWLVGVSAAAGVATLALVARRMYAASRLTAAVAVGAVIWAWAVAQRPDLLPGAVTIDDAAASHATLVALLVSFGVGALILVPSLLYLFRLTLSGRLRKEPVDESGAPLP
ncbi:MAG: cytochrome d ubiquinol oxidase subunit II [Thermoleophilia bacterium]